MRLRTIVVRVSLVALATLGLNSRLVGAESARDTK